MGVSIWDRCPVVHGWSYGPKCIFQHGVRPPYRILTFWAFGMFDDIHFVIVSCYSIQKFDQHRIISHFKYDDMAIFNMTVVRHIGFSNYENF